MERRECREGGCWDRRVLTRHDVRATRRDLTTKCPNECTKIKGQKRRLSLWKRKEDVIVVERAPDTLTFDGAFLDLS